MAAHLSLDMEASRTGSDVALLATQESPQQEQEEVSNGGFERSEASAPCASSAHQQQNADSRRSDDEVAAAWVKTSTDSPNNHANSSKSSPLSGRLSGLPSALKSSANGGLSHTVRASFGELGSEQRSPKPGRYRPSVFAVRKASEVLRLSMDHGPGGERPPGVVEDPAELEVQPRVDSISVFDYPQGTAAPAVEGEAVEDAGWAAGVYRDRGGHCHR